MQKYDIVASTYAKSNLRCYTSHHETNKWTQAKTISDTKCQLWWKLCRI